MFVIIDSDYDFVPEGVKPLVLQRAALLNLLLCLDYDPACPPLADLLRKKHGLDGNWMILSPIHCQASHNDVLIVAAGKQLQWDDIEAKSWFDLCSNYFAQEDMILYYHDASTWLLCDLKQRPLNTKPVYHLLNKSLMPELAQLDSTLFWQKFITESQMLFASKSNESLVNGLWPWGYAPLSEKKTTAICADEYFFPIAKMCSTQVSLYSPSVDLQKYQIVLLNEFSTLSALHQEELNKLSIHWYWNNAVYTTSKRTWLTRLWRTLTHAH